MASPLCVCLLKTLAIGPRAYADKPGRSPNPRFLITYFPNKVSFTSSGDEEVFTPFEGPPPPDVHVLDGLPVRWALLSVQVGQESWKMQKEGEW